MMPFFCIYISQGSVATRLGCGGVFVYDCYKFPTESNSERILKIGQYLVKLWARVGVLFLLTHGVVNTFEVCGDFGTGKLEFVFTRPAACDSRTDGHTTTADRR